MNTPNTNSSLPDVGFNPRCIFCMSQHRAEAERQYVNGMTLRPLAKWLSEKEGRPVRYESVRRHIKNHFKVRDETAKRYYDATASREVMNEAVDQRLTDIQMLDEISRQDFSVRKMTTRWISDLMNKVDPEDPTKQVLPRIPLSIVTLHNAAASEIRQNRKTKAELLGEDPNGSSVDLAVVLEEAWLNRHSDNEEGEE